MRTSLANVIRKDSALVLLLSWTAGSMDAISYVTARVLPANMTGNTVVLGLGLGLGHLAEATKPAVALCGYILGVALGVLLVDRYYHRQAEMKRAITRAVAVEAVAFVVFSIMFWNLQILGRSAVVLTRARRARGSCDGDSECDSVQTELARSRDDVYYRHDHISDVGVFVVLALATISYYDISK